MIVSLTGTVLSALGQQLVIEVGGVGYLVNVTPAHALSLRLGETTTVRTVQIVREDSLSLFGFASETERELFELLIGVTGVGPKSALGVLSALSPADIAQALEREDDAVFRAVSGIGPKTAKLIVVTLAGKISSPTLASTGASAPAATSDAVLAALTGLGWNEKAAKVALDAALGAASDTERNSVPSLLKRSLAQLSGPGR